MPDLAGPKVAYFGFCGAIDANGVSKIAAALNTAVNEQFDAVYLCLSSGGGYVGDGIFLYHHIKALPIDICIHNTGTVASIAATIFVAGKARLCSPNSIFMIHPVAMGSSERMASETLQAALDAALKDEARMESTLRERTKLPDDVLSARRTKDIYLSATQALEYGLVHEIADFALPTGNKIFQI